MTIMGNGKLSSSSVMSVLQARLEAVSDPEVATRSRRFFKTGHGEYGHGDRFRGIRVPVLRKLAGEFRELAGQGCEKLLASPFHEDRLLALLILAERYRRGSETERRQVYRCLVRNKAQVNNWDLVDSSAPYICGPYLFSRDRSVLYTWAASKDLWTRRIAIMSTFHFIRQGDYADTLRLAERLLGDQHDLIHKATGWMLREVGNRDRKRERKFLDRHAADMPRTMLRYALEKFPEAERRRYLSRTTADR